MSTPDTELYSDPVDQVDASDGPEERLLSLLSATQSTLTLEPAGRVAHINLTNSLVRGSTSSHWLKYLTQQKLLAVVCAYWLSSALFLALSFSDDMSVAVTRSLTCIHVALAMPALLCSIASLNRDMARILIMEPEFCFLSLVNAVHWSATAAAMDDVRALSCVFLWLTTQGALMVDADAQSLDATLRTSVISAATALIQLAYSFGNALGASHTTKAKLGTRALSLHDILLTTAPTLALFLLKAAHHQRGRLHTRERLPGTHARYCSIYQKRLTLQRVQPKGYRRPAQASPHLVAHRGIPLLRSHCVLSHVNTKSTVLLAPRRVAALKPLGLWLALLYILGAWGYTAAVFAAITAQIHRADPTVVHYDAIAYTALIATVVYCGTIASLFQIDLVLALARSFDVVFSSIQSSIASVCLCDMMRWDSRCVNVFTWWLWFHFTLFIDALTPPVRTLLRFKKFTLAGTVLLSIYAYVTAGVLLYYYGSSTHLLDRAWVPAPRSTPERLAVVRTESVLVGRLATLVFWNMRLFWDIGVRADEELVFLRDLVEYYTPSESCAQLFSVSPRRLFFQNAVAPVPPAPTNDLSPVSMPSAVPLQQLEPPSTLLASSSNGDGLRAAATRSKSSSLLASTAERIEEEAHEDE